MRTPFITLLILLAFLIVPQHTQAQSSNLQQALERMDQIIAEMEKLRAEFSALSSSVNQTTAAPTPAVLGVQTEAVFTHPLEFGETNDDIKRIQKLLATDPLIYPYGVASGYFGPKTEEAIKNLQAKNGWDTPGVVGPATRALLEGYFRAYPDENWPTGVLDSEPPAPSTTPTPQVQGANINIEQQLADAMQALSNAQSGSASSGGTNPAKEINVDFDEGEALIEIKYTNGNRKGYIADTTDKDEVVRFIAGRTVMTEAHVREVIDYSGRSNRDDDDDRDSDEEDAEDALDDAEDALDDAEEAIEEADEDGDDVDWAEDTLDDAEDKFEEAEEAFDDEDYDEAVELAEEAEELAEKAEDRIDEEKGSSRSDADEIDEIEVEVDDGESEVTVKYDDDDDYEFTVEEDDEDDLIEEIADELDIDEDDVEDLVEFDYGDIDKIDVRIDDDSSLVRIFYESGVERRLRLDETDEDDIIEEIADELDEDEDDVEDWTEFD